MNFTWFTALLGLRLNSMGIQYKEESSIRQKYFVPNQRLERLSVLILKLEDLVQAPALPVMSCNLFSSLCLSFPISKMKI